MKHYCRILSVLIAVAIIIISLPINAYATYITGYCYGDVNVDEVINVRDVTCLQKYIDNSITIDEDVSALCDVNQDGKYDVRDVTNIQRYIVGLGDSGITGMKYNCEPEIKTNTLVVYFSCTGTTKRLAEYLAESTGGDLFEIVPEIPYTSADLNYNNSSSRANMEQNNPTARPAISGKVDDISSYDNIIIGYPIWWGQAPKIIYTFLESYDFSNRTLVPFCTSASSGIGSSDTNLHSAVSDTAIWKSGRRFPSNTTSDTLKNWIDSLNLDIKQGG